MYWMDDVLKVLNEPGIEGIEWIKYWMYWMNQVLKVLNEPGIEGIEGTWSRYWMDQVLKNIFQGTVQHFLH